MRKQKHREGEKGGQGSERESKGASNCESSESSKVQYVKSSGSIGGKSLDIFGLGIWLGGGLATV